MPRKPKTPAPNTEEFQLDMDLWPIQPRLNAPRRIYYRGTFSKEEVAELKKRGYDPVDLITLPRDNDDEHRLYLLAKAQAMEEGTIVTTNEERRQLSLNMAAFGLLKSKDLALDLRTTSGATDVDVILDWQKSRHTFRDNSTVDLVGRTPEELREYTHKAVEEARRKAEAKIKELRKESPDRQPTKKKRQTKKKATRRANSRGNRAKGR